MSSVATVPTQSGIAGIAGRPEAVPKPDVPAPAKRGRKPGSVVAKKKSGTSPKSLHYFQVEKGYKPDSGKPPTVTKHFKDEDEAYKESFKAGSLCLRGELFSVDIVGKTLTEIPVSGDLQPE